MTAERIRAIGSLRFKWPDREDECEWRMWIPRMHASVVSHKWRSKERSLEVMRRTAESLNLELEIKE